MAPRIARTSMAEIQNSMRNPCHGSSPPAVLSVVAAREPLIVPLESRGVILSCGRHKKIRNGMAIPYKKAWLLDVLLRDLWGATV